MRSRGFSEQYKIVLVYFLRDFSTQKLPASFVLMSLVGGRVVYYNYMFILIWLSIYFFSTYLFYSSIWLIYISCLSIISMIYLYINFIHQSIKYLSSISSLSTYLDARLWVPAPHLGHLQPFDSVLAVRGVVDLLVVVDGPAHPKITIK